MAMDSDALAAAMPRLQPELTRIIRRRLRGRQDVNDVLQQTWLQALRHLRQLRDPGKIEPWLHQIARRVITHDARRPVERPLSELADAVERAARPETRASLTQDLDDMVRRLSAYASDEQALVILTLRHCLHWPVRRVAAALSLSPHTVSAVIARARKSMLDAPAAADPDAELRAKLTVGAMLWNTAANPVDGEHALNFELAREAYAYIRLVWLRHPDSPEANFRMLNTCFLYAQLSEYTGPGDTPREIRDWQRGRWDRGLIEEGMRVYRHLAALDPPRHIRLLCDILVAVFRPARLEEIDLDALMKLYHEFFRLRPENNLYLMAAEILGALRTPLEGARFLERYKNNPMLREGPRVHGVLAKLYYRAGYWREALACYRKRLRWPCDRATRKRLQQDMAECERQRVSRRVQSTRASRRKTA